jgi:dipeptidyl aminopeptidase/acylaminoacyl peptidase
MCLSLPRARLASAILLLSAGSLAAPAVQARPVALDDTIAFTGIDDLQVSPDGGRVALCVTRRVAGENRFATDIVMAPADGSASERFVTRAPGDDCRPRFSPDGRALAFLSDRGGSDQVWVMPVDGGEPVAVTRHPQGVAAFEWAANGRDIFFTAEGPRPPEAEAASTRGDDAFDYGAAWRRHRLWRVAVGTEPGPGRALTPDTIHVTDPIAPSPDGRRIALLTMPTPEPDASEEAKVQVMDLASGEVTDVPGSQRAVLVAWAGDELLFTRPFDGAGWSRLDLFSWRLGDREPRDRSGAIDRDIEQVVVDPHGAVDVVYSRGAVSEVAPISPEPATPRAGKHPAQGEIGAVAGATWKPLYPVAWPQRVGDARLFVRLDRPGEVWRLDRRGEPRPITHLNAGLTTTLDLPRLETVTWRSDGRSVEGVLTTPPAGGGAARGPYPLLVRPHGGPRAQSLLEFGAQNAYFASLGYLVFEPNFRGSTGYGDAFTKANGGDWGTGPFADVMAGVDALVAAGRADPQRLYLFGWSYGGIVANWAATHSDRFKGIVSGAGVADFRMQYILSDARRWRFDYFGGSPFLPQYLPAYTSNSPVTHVGKVTTPVLFLQGEADKRCPLPQALMMHRAILDAGGQSELVIFPREGHGFREPEHLLDRSRRVAAFFAAHGGPAAPKADASVASSAGGHDAGGR